MKTVVMLLLGVVLGVVLVVGCVYAYFASGTAPAATDAPDMPFEKTLAKKALAARINREMPTSNIPAADDARLLDGAGVYRAQCAVCHGLPGAKKTNIAAGMYPRPPQLFEHGVDDDPAGETWWKVANGIRLTGMPGYKTTLSEAQVWDVTLLLTKKLADLPTAVQDELKKPLPE